MFPIGYLDLLARMPGVKHTFFVRFVVIFCFVHLKRYPDAQETSRYSYGSEKNREQVAAAAAAAARIHAVNVCVCVRTCIFK